MKTLSDAIGALALPLMTLIDDIEAKREHKQETIDRAKRAVLGLGDDWRRERVYDDSPNAALIEAAQASDDLLKRNAVAIQALPEAFRQDLETIGLRLRAAIRLAKVRR